MKKNFTNLATAVAALGLVVGATAAPVQANEPVKLNAAMKAAAMEKAQKAIKMDLYPSEVVPVPLKSPRKEASAEHKSVLVYEDFDYVPDGQTEVTGDLGDRPVTLLASQYYSPGIYIDNGYTPESGTWAGDWVYAGKGGTVIIQTYNPMQPGWLSTPLGDYSGDLTVTVRARWAKAFWGASNDLGWTSTSGSSLDLAVRVGGYENGKAAVTDDVDMGLTTGQLYEADGWQEITYTVRNESANNDGYLMLATSGAIEIDWIKVTDNNTFLACPVMEPVTDFREDGFTINWQPVRRSYNYYIDLWQANWLADSGVDVTYDFEDSKLPEGVTADEAEFSADGGVDGSVGLVLGYDGVGAAFTTPDYGMNLDTFECILTYHLENAENYDAIIWYEGLGENGWERLGSLQNDGYWTTPDDYYIVSLRDSSSKQFSGKYSAVRFYTEGYGANDKICIDNVKVYAHRPYELARVEGSDLWDPEEDDYPYNTWDNTQQNDPCSYTFEGLDPNTEYYYRVRSHNVSDFTVGEKYHAFGVAAPALSTPTNVANGSYTAHWTDVSKAQNYTVNNYATAIVEQSEPEYTLFSETFSKCSGTTDIMAMTPLDNASGSLDDYTDMKGWTGADNIIGQNMIGVGWYSINGYLTSPALMFNPDREGAYLYLEINGNPGDAMLLTFEKSGAYGTVNFDDNGMISGFLPVSTPLQGEKISFTSYNYYPFGVSAFEAVQSMEAGDTIYFFDSAQRVPAGTQACTFTNLEGENYSYDVVAEYYLEGETAFSDNRNKMGINLTTGETVSVLEIQPANRPTEISRYTVDGRQVGKDTKGIVLVKMSDGSVRKQIVK